MAKHCSGTNFLFSLYTWLIPKYHKSSSFCKWAGEGKHQNCWAPASLVFTDAWTPGMVSSHQAQMAVLKQLPTMLHNPFTRSSCLQNRNATLHRNIKHPRLLNSFFNGKMLRHHASFNAQPCFLFSEYSYASNAGNSTLIFLPNQLPAVNLGFSYIIIRFQKE